MRPPDPSDDDLAPAEGLNKARRDAENERLGLLLDAARAGVWDWSVSGEAQWSPETEAICGLPPGTLAGTLEAFLERIHPSDRARVTGEIRRALDDPHSGEHFESEYRVVHGDGSIVWVEARWRVYRDEAGFAVTMAGIVLDNTRHHQLQQQLVHAQKMETVGRLAGGIAHDFNNLLTAIGAAIELARMGHERSDQHLATASHAIERAAMLVRQLLTFARRQPVALRVLAPEPALTHVSGLLQRLLPESITLRLDTTPPLWNVRADPIQLEQLLVNLAVNARDAMSQGGALRIGARNVTLETDASDVAAGEYLELVVQDDGSGIDEVHLPNLFEPFFTTKPEGTGLGLATVYGIVQQSQGHISVSSMLGTGTTFTILLPRAEEQHAAREVRDVPGAPVVARSGTTVLAVEDNELVRRVLGSMLKASGYEVLVADGGPRALEMADAHPGVIDVLVTDVVMPVMSGPQLAEELRRRRPNIRVLLTSGYAGESLDLGTLGGGAVFLQKPYSGTTLCERIEALLATAAKS